jgi:hypothetical protein
VSASQDLGDGNRHRRNPNLDLWHNSETPSK